MADIGSDHWCPDRDKYAVPFIPVQNRFGFKSRSLWDSATGNATARSAQRGPSSPWDLFGGNGSSLTVSLPRRMALICINGSRMRLVGSASAQAFPSRNARHCKTKETSRMLRFVSFSFTLTLNYSASLSTSLMRAISAASPLLGPSL